MPFSPEKSASDLFKGQQALTLDSLSSPDSFIKKLSKLKYVWADLLFPKAQPMEWQPLAI